MTTSENISILQTQDQDKPLTAREVISIMNNQMNDMRTEFITIVKDLAHKIDTTKSENTYFQTMEHIMNNGSLQRQKQVETVENLNIVKDQSENTTQNVTEYDFPCQYQSSRDDRSKSSSKIQDPYDKIEKSNTHQIRHSLDYTDSKFGTLANKSHSANNLMNKNFDYLKNIMDVGKENIGVNYESNISHKLLEQSSIKQPCPS